MSRTIFDIGADLEAIDQLMEELDGDISDPVVEKALTEWFEQAQSDLGAKLDNYVNYAKRLESVRVAAKAEADQYAKRVQVIDNRIKSLKWRLADFFDRSGRRTCETATGRKVRLQANGGVQTLELDEIDISHIPVRFRKTVVTIDTAVIRDALNAGEILPFARLLPRGESIRF